MRTELHFLPAFVFFYQLVHILYHLLPALHFKHPDKRTIYKHADHNTYKLKHYSFPRTSCLISTQKNWRCPLHRCYHMWNNVKIHCRICNQEIQDRNYQNGTIKIGFKMTGTPNNAISLILNKTAGAAIPATFRRLFVFANSKTAITRQIITPVPPMITNTS